MNEARSDIPYSAGFDESRLQDPRARRLLKQRFYQWVLDQAKGNRNRLGWDAASDTLQKYTGVRIPAETLRQNFKPASSKSGKPPRHFNDVERWRAIFEFLTSDAVGYLEAEELTAACTPLACFRALHAFLNTDPEVSDRPLALAGRFSNEWLSGPSSDLVLTIDIDEPLSGGVVPVTARMKWAVDMDGFNEPNQMTYCGAAVTAPSGFFVAVLRDDIGGQVVLYAVLQANPPPVDEGVEIQDIAVFAYNGLSTGALERIEHTVPDMTDAPGYTEYRLDGITDRHIMFLTRC